jgi:hypothetical protein
VLRCGLCVWCWEPCEDTARLLLLVLILIISQPYPQQTLSWLGSCLHSHVNQLHKPTNQQAHPCTPVHGVEVSLLLLLIFKVHFLATLREHSTTQHSSRGSAQGGEGGSCSSAAVILL